MTGSNAISPVSVILSNIYSDNFCESISALMLLLLLPSEPIISGTIAHLTLFTRAGIFALSNLGSFEIVSKIGSKFRILTSSSKREQRTSFTTASDAFSYFLTNCVQRNSFSLKTSSNNSPTY